MFAVAASDESHELRQLRNCFLSQGEILNFCLYLSDVVCAVRQIVKKHFLIEIRILLEHLL